ncbi:hypothetical protein B0H15DRAFT_157435 [Mycena belliarum]|uniref:Uncharacterized protein n=1 Tax=Mycena belliarum TaxID=1033014 RepID=A0AAD6UCK1_9AGAR|nr:hypothetical protein B0H15DRAFT_157435 [Mycena belliae]
MATSHTDLRSPPGYDESLEASPSKGSERTSPEKPKGEPLSPRYVYYCVYGLDGPILPRGELSGYHPSIGRIKATSIPPPHTVASLKRALAQAEKLPDPDGALTALYQTKGARAAMAASERVTITTGDIGATPQTPMALVFLPEVPDARSRGTCDDEFASSEASPWLYYRLYTRDGEASSTRAFDTAEPALGRIRRDLISPPRNAASIMRRIAKVEGKAIYAWGDLFTDMSADRAQSGFEIMTDAFGAAESDPIMIVQPERRAGLHNRPLWFRSPPEKPYSWFLGTVAGEIVLTDGVPAQYHPYNPDYTAVRQNGQMGRVIADPRTTRFLDEDSAPAPNADSNSCTLQ